MRTGSLVLDRRGNALGRSKSVGLRIKLGVSDDHTMASWLEESLVLLARGLLLRPGSTFVVHVGRGLTLAVLMTWGGGGDFTSAPSFPFLIYSPAPACRLASGASLGWEW